MNYGLFCSTFTCIGIQMSVFMTGMKKRKSPSLWASHNQCLLRCGHSQSHNWMLMFQGGVLCLYPIQIGVQLQALGWAEVLILVKSRPAVNLCVCFVTGNNSHQTLILHLISLHPLKVRIKNRLDQNRFACYSY